MRHTHLTGRRVRGVVVAAALAITATATTAMAASSAASGDGHASSPDPGALGSVLLINGDRVRDTTGIGTSLTPGGVLLRFGAGGQRYTVPSTALPYLGRGLDPSLFRLGGLGEAERGGRLPLAITYSGRVPRLPGVTITAAGSGHAAGYLTAASGALFGSALARQFAYDHPRGSYGTDGLFRSGVRIGLAGSAPASLVPPRPRFPMHVLTVHGINLAGGPDTGDTLEVVNVDNAAILGIGGSYPGSSSDSNGIFDHGTMRYAIPNGHYCAIGMFYDTAGAFRFVVLPQFTVNGDTSVTVDERTATSKLSIKTPRPTAASDYTLEVARIDATGKHNASVGVYDGNGGPLIPLYLNTTTVKPTVGKLQVFAGGEMLPPSGSAYAYELGFADTDGLIHPISYTAAPATLATVRERMYANVPGQASFGLGGWFPRYPASWGWWVGGGTYPKAPWAMTLYVTGGPTVSWIGTYVPYDPSYQEFGLANDYRPGTVTNDDWDAFPLHPAAPVPITASQPDAAFIGASRSGNMLALDYSPFSDGTGHHTGRGFDQPNVRGTYRITANGVTVAAGNAASQMSTVFDAWVRLPAKPVVIGFTLTDALSGHPFTYSAASSTTWTWHSAWAGRHIVPSSWYCSGRTASTAAAHDCVAQPLLTLGYSLAGEGLNGLAPPGTQTLGLTVGHLPLAAAPAIRTVTAKVSFDGGKTWHAAVVTGRGGSYRAVYTAPAGAFVTLRVTAADAAGGTISETITGAYGTRGKA